MSKSEHNRPAIQMVEVSSSQVVKAGYDPSTKTMAVEFSSGGTYYYTGVAQSTYEDLFAAKSFGKHLQANVVGKYPHKKIDHG